MIIAADLATETAEGTDDAVTAAMIEGLEQTVVARHRLEHRFVITAMNAAISRANARSNREIRDVRGE